MNRKVFLQGFSGLFVPFMAKSPPDMVIAQTIAERIEQARQAWLVGDGIAFTNLFVPNGEFIVPGQRWPGREAILAAFQDFAAIHQVRQITLRNLVVQGDRAILEWYWEAIDLETGEVSRAEDAIAIDFQGSYIQRWREYIDDVSPPQES